LRTAQYHLDNLKSQDVTILYDTYNNDVFKNLKRNGKQTSELKASKADDLKQLDPGKMKAGFMLIPNAMYYNYCDPIPSFVDGKIEDGTVKRNLLSGARVQEGA
jgi:hypothetical protein